MADKSKKLLKVILFLVGWDNRRIVTDYNIKKQGCNRRMRLGLNF